MKKMPYHCEAKQQLRVLACPELLVVKTAQLLLNSLLF